MGNNVYLTLYNIDDIGQTGINYDASSIESPSNPIQLADGRGGMSHKYASLDGSWELDGSYRLAPRASSQGKMGWWASELSDQDGNFINEQSIKINMTGSDLNTIDIIFDDKREEYAVDFDINVYYNGSLVGNSPYQYNNNVNHTIVDNIDNISLYDSIEIKIYKWSNSNRQVKLSQLIEKDIKYFDNNDIIGFSFLEEAVNSGGLTGARTSSNELVINFYNKDDKFSFFNQQSDLSGIMQENRLIELQLEKDGQLYNFGRFWTNSWNIKESQFQVSLVANDIIMRMGNGIYKNVQNKNNVSAYQIIEDIFIDFGLISYEIDDVFNNYTIDKSYMGLKSHRSALEDVMEAFGGFCYTNRDGSLIVKCLSSIVEDTVAKEDLTLSKLFNKDILFKKEEYNNFEVKKIKFNAKEKEEIMREDIEIIGGENYKSKVIFSEQPLDDITVSLGNNNIEATIINLEIYSWGFDIEISSISSGYIDIVVEAISFKKSLNTHLHSDGSLIYKIPDSHFRQNNTVINNIFDIYNNIYNMKSLYIECDYNIKAANFIDLLDNFTSYTLKDDESTMKKFKVLKQEVEYDGGLDIKLKGRTVE